MKKSIVIGLVVLLMITLVSCSIPQDAFEKKEITVAAASDLTKAFTEVGAAFEKANNCIVTFSFGSTGTLSEQVANGAPFDVFAAANENIIDELSKDGHIITETKKLYALGRIGIATAKNNNIEVKTIEDLSEPEIKKIAIANPDHAPYGLAAKQALVNAGLWDKLKSKLVYGKNISETLTLITTGNAEAGFIALSLNDPEILNFNLVDGKMHEPLKQAMAVTKNAKDVQLAKMFIEYVNSSEGKEIMSKYGFITPEE